MQKEKVIVMLFDKYGSYDLTPKQVSKIMERSEQTLWRMRRDGRGPKYRRIGDAVNSPVHYPIHLLAAYLLNEDIVITVG